MASEPTVSKVFYEKGMVSFSCIKRLKTVVSNGPRSAKEVMEITLEQYHMLMQGMEIVVQHPIQEVKNPAYAM